MSESDRESRPAWSSAFAPDRLVQVEPVELLDSLGPEWAWGNSTGGGVRVAVIDSGVDPGHPAIGGPLAGAVTVEAGPSSRPLVREAPPSDEYGHGTACAGIIRSLAPDCELYSVKVLGPHGGRGAAFAAGLRWAIDQGVQVCNLSLGTTNADYYRALHELADLAYFRNVALVAAANNLPTPSYPSMFGAVFSVAAHEYDDPRLVYYNPRPPVEFGAPGMNLRVAWAEQSWVMATGNSFAAPHVSGLLARVLARHPDLTIFQLKTVLRSLAANIQRPEPTRPEPGAELD